MLNYENSRVTRVTVHHTGNKNNGEELILSSEELDIRDDRLKGLLLKFFLSSFKNNEYFSFTSDTEDVKENPLFNSASVIFDSQKALQEESVNIARKLFDASTHPQVKPGDLFVAFISDIIVDDEITDAVGIFKSETRQSFLKLENNRSSFSLQYDDGININKLDKGALILNSEKSLGYRIAIVDNISKGAEAEYWKTNFLNLKPFNDDFYFTKQVLTATKNFVTEEIPEDIELSKTDRINLLNKSVEYFKTHDNYNKSEFEDDVLQDKGLIQSFRGYAQKYSNENDFDLADTFEISENALRQQAKLFKGVLKLDKNFHVYIHGDTRMIEKGVDRDGRKYYKIYFEKES